ncbi:MAG TPA: CATRA system-associated protein [Actinoplanes sp.]|nr:CATRA system-associated protein [Actinoplanes sp.]
MVIPSVVEAQMDAGEIYRSAERTLRAVGGQRMSQAGWHRYHAAAEGLRLALFTGDLEEVVAVTNALATLGIPRQKAAADPYRTTMPRSLRPTTATLLACLSALADQHLHTAD